MLETTIRNSSKNHPKKSSLRERAFAASEMHPRERASRLFPCRRQRRQHQGAKQVIHFLSGKRVSTFHPPIQHLNKSRGQVLNQEIRWNPARGFPPALKFLSDVIGNQLRQHLLQVFMEDGATPGPDLGLAGAPVLIVVLEDGKAEPDHPLVTLRGGWWLRRLHGTKHVVDTADEQLVFVITSATTVAAVASKRVPRRSKSPTPTSTMWVR
jgi:hypothetical protein